MRVLGLDLSSNSGYAVADNGEIIVSGTKRLKGKLGQRLQEFEEWLRSFIREHCPDSIVYERPHFRGYAATLSGVGLIATVEKISYETGLHCEGVHTATLKKFATNYGKANKAAMTGAANLATGKQLEVVANNDEADAIHLALYGGTNV